MPVADAALPLRDFSRSRRARSRRPSHPSAFSRGACGGCSGEAGVCAGRAPASCLAAFSASTFLRCARALSSRTCHGSARSALRRRVCLLASALSRLGGFPVPEASAMGCPPRGCLGNSTITDGRRSPKWLAASIRRKPRAQGQQKRPVSQARPMPHPRSISSTFRSEKGKRQQSIAVRRTISRLVMFVVSSRGRGGRSISVRFFPDGLTLGPSALQRVGRRAHEGISVGGARQAGRRRPWRPRRSGGRIRRL